MYRKDLFIYVDMFPHRAEEQIRSVVDDKYTVNTQLTRRVLAG